MESRKESPYLCSIKAIKQRYKRLEIMTTITNNEQLNSFVSEMNSNQTMFAVRVKGEIRIHNNKRSFNKDCKNNPNAVQGEFTAYNFIWYRF